MIYWLRVLLRDERLVFRELFSEFLHWFFGNWLGQFSLLNKWIYCRIRILNSQKHFFYWETFQTWILFIEQHLEAWIHRLARDFTLQAEFNEEKKILSLSLGFLFRLSVQAKIFGVLFLLDCSKILLKNWLEKQRKFRSNLISFPEQFLLSIDSWATPTIECWFLSKGLDCNWEILFLAWLHKRVYKAPWSVLLREGNFCAVLCFFASLRDLVWGFGSRKNNALTPNFSL